jgi:WD40 repeat protein
MDLWRGCRVTFVVAYIDTSLEQCTCWVCFEIFEEPITLLCTHSFCKECMVKVYKKDAQCPFCRRPFNLPLPDVNKTLEQLVIVYKTKKDGAAGDAAMQAFIDQDSIFLQLPAEVLVGMMTFLNPKEVARSSRVCHTLSELSSDGWIWREFAQKASPFCNVDKYNRNWKRCYVGMFKRQLGWDSGKAGDFEVVTMRGHNDYVSCFSFYHSKIVSGSADSSLKVWNAQKNTCLATLNGHHGVVQCVQFNETRIASGATDGFVKLWDLGTGIAINQVNASGPVHSLLAEENELITGSDRVRVFDTRSMEQVHALSAHLQPIREVKKDDQGRIVCCSADSLKVWDTRVAPDDGRIRLGPDPVHGPRNVLAVPGASCFQISRDNIIAGRPDGSVSIHNVQNNQNIQLAAANWSNITCLQSDGTKVVTGSADNSLRVYDLERRRLLHTLAGHTAPINAVQFDTQKVVSGSADNTLKVWRMDNGQRLYSLLGGSLQQRGNNKPHPTKAGCSSLQYDESCIAASFNSLVRVYNFEPGDKQE